MQDGFVLSGRRSFAVNALANVMRRICDELKIAERVTPHDLRRSWSTRAAELGIDESLIDRLLNHREQGSVVRTYVRYTYGKEDQRAMERVAAHIMAKIEGTAAENVFALRR